MIENLRKVPLPVRVAAAVGAGLLATVLATGCAAESAQQNSPTVEAPAVASEPEHVTACKPDQRRPLPSATNVGEIKDTRGKKIYACMYLMDVGIQPDTAIPLFNLREETVESSSFKLKANLGGWAILGVGAISGSAEGEGSGGETDVYKFSITNMDGILQNVTVPAAKVGIKPCPDECKPTITVSVPDEKLYEKELDEGWNGKPDNRSIWYGPGVYESHLNQSWVKDEKRRQNVVSQLARKAPEEPRATTYSGGPRDVSEVIGALSESVIVKLPASAINK